jgi:quercetin dioxygenase-like cupin family protein
VSGEIRILDAATGPELPIIEGGGVARAIVWPGVGAELRSLHRIWLEPGATTVTLAHPSDAVYYVLEGSGSAHDESTGAAHEVRQGSMFHVDAGTSYAIIAGDGAMQLVGGPAPADPAMYAHLVDGV